jgi:succinate dehydrogenase/fumarate reductase flavoprotein subunit
MSDENTVNKGISRRDFLKDSAIGLAALGGGSVLAGCQPKVAATEAPKAEQAAATAAPQATGAADWLGSAPVIKDADCVETVAADVLVVGAGCAGFFAAAAAAEAGAKVLLIEKLETPNGIRSSALAAVGSKAQKAANVEIDKAEIINDICHYALNHNDMTLVKTWADNSAEAIDWYCDFVEKKGKCEIKLEYTMPGQETRYHMWPTGHGTKSKSDENAEALVTKDMVEYITSFSGCEVRTNTKMECLIKDGAKVVGIYASNKEGKYIRINAAKGVIVATGGYARNEQMYTALQGDTKKSLVGLMAFLGATGDGIKAAIWAGAKFEPFHSTMIFDRGAIAPNAALGDPWNGGMPYYHIATQPFLKVNKAGNRICNESSPYDFIVHAASRFEGKGWYQIFDSNWKEDVTRFHTIGCSTLLQWDGGNHHPEGLDAVEQAINGMIEKGLVFKADTIEELAGKLGIDSANLTKTAARYNELYDGGADVDFGKEFFRMSSLKTAPYYGAKIGGLMLCTMDGVYITPNGQAIGEDDKPIEGLFVVGNDGGGYYYSTYPNFGAGTNAGRCATFGRICGKHVAAL